MNGVINQTGSLPDPCPLTPGRLIIKYRQIFKVNRKKQGGGKLGSQRWWIYTFVQTAPCVCMSLLLTRTRHTRCIRPLKNTHPPENHGTHAAAKKKDDGFVSRKYAMLTTNEINTPIAKERSAIFSGKNFSPSLRPRPPVATSNQKAYI